MSPTPEGRGGGGYTGMFRRYTILLLSVVNRVQSFWTGSLSKNVKTCDERCTFAIPTIVFLIIYFLDFSVKNYLILYAKQSKSGSESSVSCLKQSREMSNFCLKQGRGLKASAHSSTQTSLEYPLPPPPGFQLPWLVLTPCKGIRIPETAGNFSLWNPESRVLESRIHLKESGIPLTIGIRNPNFTDKESRIQYMKSGIHGVESRM